MSPASIDVSLAGGVTIVWRDGHRSVYAIPALRAACPCATCHDLHGTGAPTPAPASPLPMFTPRGATLLGAEQVGNYAMQFHFSDRHTTGIYTWEHLRKLCPCEACAATRSGRAAVISD